MHDENSLLVAGNGAGERELAMRSLQLDSLTSEVTQALSRDGIRSILLKGRAIEAWLYESVGPRPSSDVDLLVNPAEIARAELVLVKLGFRAGQRGWRDVSRSWSRDAGEVVDLHSSLFGFYADPPDVWEGLTAATDEIMIGGRSIETLGVVARSLHVATHAAQHGFERAVKPRADLELALDQLDSAVWGSAATLAAELDALSAFGAGLRMNEAGAALAASLDLPPTRSLTVHLHSTGAEPMVLGVESLMATPGLSRKASFAIRKAFPSSSHLRAHSQVARRGPLGLAIARVWHPVALALRLPVAFASWRRAKADLERPQDPQEK